MITFGQILRNAREAHGLSISQLAERTHILAQTIDEMEHHDFHSIAAPIYGRGFVRILAEELELDPQPLVREFMALLHGEPSTLEQMPVPPPPPAPGPVPPPVPAPGPVPPPAPAPGPVPVAAPVPEATSTPSASVPNAETPPVASIFASFKSTPSGSVPTVEPPVTGSVPTVEPPVTGSVPTTEPPVTGSVPMTEPPVTGSVPTTEQPVTGSVPTTEQPVTGSVPTVEPPVTGSVPTVEPPVTGSVPTPQPTVVNGLDLFEQAAAASQQKSGSVTPETPFAGTVPTGSITGTVPTGSITGSVPSKPVMGTVPTGSVTGTVPTGSAKVDSPYLPSDFETQAQGPSMFEAVRKGVSSLGIALSDGVNRIPRSSWRKCVLALAAVAVLALIVFGCIKLYQLTAPAKEPVATQGSSTTTTRISPDIQYRKTAPQPAATGARTQPTTATGARTQQTSATGTRTQQSSATRTVQATKSQATRTPRPTTPGKLQSTGQKVPSLYVD